MINISQTIKRFIFFFNGFQNMTNTDVNRELVTNKQVTQLIFADDKKNLS
jgi:hypothetical protein